MVGSPSRKPKAKRAYPLACNILDAVNAARESGIDVNEIEISSNGNITVREVKSQPASKALSEFDEWNAEGRL
jgi:hypothetical protein